MRKLSIGLLGILALNTHANVIQYFAGISYNNPSELFKVKKSTFLIGGTGFYGDLAFRGSILNFNTLQYESGLNHSRTYTLLPYGRIAKRINDKSVVAIDVTQPFNSNLNWGENTFTRYANTGNYLTDIDVSPKFSYALGKKLQVGGGLNFNFLLNNEVNWAFPTGETTYGTLVNRSSSFGLGYNIGATYLINQSNFLGVTYYSKIKQNTSGVSYLYPFINNNYAFSFNMPATIILSYVHIFNPKWLISLQGFKADWNINQVIHLYNTAAPAPFSNFTFNMNFSQANALFGVVRNQFTEKLGLSLAGMMDRGPEKEYLRNITFPCYVQYFIGLMGDYHFNKQVSVELLYGHVFSNPPIHNYVDLNNVTIPFTTGKVDINADVVDLKLKVEV